MSDLDKIESVIGPSLVVKGEIQSSGTLRIDGVVEGSIGSDGSVIVARDGIAQADIKADHIVIGGTVNGNIIARKKVEMLSTGKLHGDVTTVAYGFIVQEGAIFEGACKMKKPDDAKMPLPKTPHAGGVSGKP